jgi:hypothetical protein
MKMAPNHHRSAFSMWVARLEEHICGHICPVYEGENINKTIHWARPLRTTINSSQTRVKGRGLKSIIQPTSFQVVARKTHDDTGTESLDSTIGYADSTDSIESENSSVDLVEEDTTSIHLIDGDGRHVHLSPNKFEDGDTSNLDTEICRGPRRAWRPPGTLRLDPTGRILDDDKSSQSTSSFLRLSQPGSKLENVSSWRSTSISVIRSPTSSRVGNERSSRLTGRSCRNPHTPHPHSTDREETMYARNYLSTIKGSRESVLTNSVSDTYYDSDSEESSSKSSCSSFVVEEARGPFDQDLLKTSDKGEARQGISEFLSQSIRTPVASMASSTSGIEEVCTATTRIHQNTTPSRTKLIRPTAPRRRTTSQFKRTANQFRMIERAKAESEKSEVSKKVAQTPKTVLPPSRRGRHNQRRHWG